MILIVLTLLKISEKEEMARRALIKTQDDTTQRKKMGDLSFLYRISIFPFSLFLSHDQ